MDTLSERYERFIFDLDGTLWLGAEPLPHVADVLGALRSAGKRIAFCTNSPQRSAALVAETLVGLGVEAAEEEVITSGRAACRYLAGAGFEGRDGFVIGGDGLRRDLGPLGLRFLGVDDGHRAEVVVIGRDYDCTYATLRTAFRAVHAGAHFVATNTDQVHPAADGLEPGGGALVAAVEYAAGRSPVVVGKPAEPMLMAADEVLGAPGPTLMVGDKPESDVAGAKLMGWDSALVLTGVTTPGDVMDPAPDLVIPDLSALVT